jgi:hypothetical protein
MRPRDPLTTHALDTSDAAHQFSTGLTVLKYLDLGVLAIALPVFLATGLPMVGYATVAAAWLVQRAIQTFAAGRAVATGDRRAALSVLAGTMVARIWLLGLSVLAAGLIEREAGVAAGLLAVALFTTFFVTLLIVKPLEEAARR